MLKNILAIICLPVMVVVGLSSFNTEPNPAESQVMTLTAGEPIAPFESSPSYMPPRALEVFPAVGKTHGVKVTGKGASVTYGCSEGLVSFNLPRAKGIEYNGTTVQYVDDNATYGSGPNFDLNNQYRITIRFGGDTERLATRVVSMIVHNRWSSAMNPANLAEDKVVNLDPNAVRSGNIELRTSNFSFGYIDDIDFCIKTFSGPSSLT